MEGVARDAGISTENVYVWIDMACIDQGVWQNHSDVGLCYVYGEPGSRTTIITKVLTPRPANIKFFIVSSQFQHDAPTHACQRCRSISYSAMSSSIVSMIEARQRTSLFVITLGRGVGSNSSWRGRPLNLRTQSRHVPSNG